MLYYITAKSTNIINNIMKNQFRNSLIHTMGTG